MTGPASRISTVRSSRVSSYTRDMKLQLGLLHLDDRPSVPDDLARVLGELGSHPAETAGEIADGPLVMAYRGDKITLEEEFETQPFESGPYVLTWDGRLDNREELGRRLGLKGLNNVSDPAIVLRAYESFGERVFNDLIGEFALALWCRTTRSLQFARSACGARTLYYVLNKNSLIWSSDFAHLVTISGVDLTVNDDYVLEYLVAQPHGKYTPLAKVDAIPPNRLTHFEIGRVMFTRELWNPTRISPLRYRTDQDYEEHCRENIKEAVKVRLRAKHPVFAELSGGLDSSTVVLMADEVLRDSNESPEKLQTLSYVYEVSQSCDERRFIQAVVEKRGVDTLIVHEENQRITIGLDDLTFTGIPNALHCFPGRYQQAAALMSQYQARILLTGLGGDHLFWSEPDGTPIIADKLRKADVLGGLRQTRTWSQVTGTPYYELLAQMALPLVVESLLPTRSGYKRPEIPAWICPEHRENLRSSLPNVDGFTTWHAAPSKRAQVFVVDHMFRYTSAGFLHEYRDMYASHPYTHRPLVEFCLATPLSQFLREGQTRSLMRRALAGLLPSKTTKRASKGILDETIVRAVHREWDKTSDIANWQVCNRGYVDCAQLAESLNQARLGIIHLTGPLIRLFSLERWLRSLGRVGSSQEQTKEKPPSVFTQVRPMTA
jgi:asparagine synthase (glutamine-hydrolysing)